MEPRTRFLLQLLQKLGAPLMSSIAAHGLESDRQEASTMAGLLSESVKIGISLSQALNLKPQDGDTDAIRVAMTALAAQLIAEAYRHTGRVPGEAEAQRIGRAFDSVIVFADNFAPAAEHAQRLETLDGSPPFFDPVQTNIYTLHALLPVIAAISEFSFGQSETRLAQDVVQRLTAKARDMREKLAAGGNPMAELVILQALGQIYASVHRGETARSRQNAEEQAEPSLDAVWPVFDRQVSMIEVLLESMAGRASSTATASRSAVKPDMVEAPAMEAPAAAMPPPPPPQRPAAGGSPMSFFKKR
jgi:hypothetical protein